MLLYSCFIIQCNLYEKECLNYCLNPILSGSGLGDGIGIVFRLPNPSIAFLGIDY